MARASSGHAVGGGTSIQSVKIRSEWEELITQVKSGERLATNARRWSDEENAFIIKARAAGVFWDDIGKALGCSDETARKQWRKLTTK